MQHQQTRLKLGTRRSLLALAQSTWVARQIEKLNPEVQVELVGVETQGDRIQDIPLSKIEGKEFFVAEIDHALKREEIDFAVHSLKDLSLQRPADFTCAAIPVRENARDVILFGPQILEKLAQNLPIKIGTSSPRRLENIPNFLEKALPRVAPALAEKPKLELVEIRGNVTTRLSRVHEPAASPKALDAVVLAFAGLIRLDRDPDGRAGLEKLLKGVRWMVLPLAECPAAPGQGALAVECRAQDENTLRILKKLHHEATARQVELERKILSDWGGGCHQRFGATVGSTKGLDDLLFIRGKKPDQSFVEELRWNPPLISPAHRITSLWDGSQFRGESVEVKDLTSVQILLKEEKFSSVFVAHSRAVPLALEKEIQKCRVWTSGFSSWIQLAKRGIWVEGCAEALGFENLIPTLKEPVLNLPHLTQWITVTHQEGREEWENLGIQAVPTYEVQFNYPKEVQESVKKASDLFWSSGSQFNALKEYVSQTARHACGPGKTADRLRSQGINPLIFPSAKEWRKWIASIN